jgi:hypothetical protein
MDARSDFFRTLFSPRGCMFRSVGTLRHTDYFF